MSTQPTNYSVQTEGTNQPADVPQEGGLPAVPNTANQVGLQNLKEGDTTQPYGSYLSCFSFPSNPLVTHMIQDTKEFAKTMTEAGKTAWKTTSTYLQAAVEEEEQEQEVEREVETPPSSEDETFNFTENEKIAQEIAVVKEQLKQLENRQQALLTNQDKPPVTESPVQKENPTKELLAGWIKRGDMDAVCEAVTHKEKLEKIVPHIKDPTKKEEFDQRIQEVTQWLQEMQTKI